MASALPTPETLALQAEIDSAMLGPEPSWNAVLECGSGSHAKQHFEAALEQFLRMDPAEPEVTSETVQTEAQLLLRRLRCIRVYDADWHSVAYPSEDIAAGISETAARLLTSVHAHSDVDSEDTVDYEYVPTLETLAPQAVRDCVLLGPEPSWNTVLHLGGGYRAKPDFETALADFQRLEPGLLDMTSQTVRAQARRLLRRLRCIRLYDAEWHSVVAPAEHTAAMISARAAILLMACRAHSDSESENSVDLGALNSQRFADFGPGTFVWPAWAEHGVNADVVISDAEPADPDSVDSPVRQHSRVLRRLGKVARRRAHLKRVAAARRRRFR